MKSLPAVLTLTALACTPIASGGGDVIAIEVRTPANVQLVVGDTIVLDAVAITAAGHEAKEIQVVWSILDVDSGQVGFTLDTLSGQVAAIAPGDNTRVQARVGNLRADPVTIGVRGPTPHFRRP